MPDFSGAIVNQSSQDARERLLRYQRQSLRDLLSYIWKHSAFYRDYYQSYGIREDDLTEISVGDLPFISKEILMENFDTAVTDRRLRRRELEEWIQKNRDPRQRYHEDFIVIHSSGSSGNIGVFAYDRTAWQVMNSTMAGHLPIPHSTCSQKIKIAFYLASHGHFAGVITAVQMPESVYDVLIISLLDRSEQVVEQLNSFQPDRLTGYSSSITHLADLALQGKLRIHPQLIFVSGDPLTDYMEQKIQRAWVVPVHNIYATSESLCLAVKKSGQEEMAVLEDLNILEVLDDRNQPVSPGEEGRVVLTNLYNFALPILRYELGDYVVRGTTRHNSPFATIQNIQSAKINDALPIALDNGKQDTISPRILSSFYVVDLEKVQFTSTQPDLVEIEYIAQHNIDALIRSEFQRILNMKGAAGTQFVVRRVHHIANDAQTGKLRLVRVEGTQRMQLPIPVENRPAQESTHGRRVSPTNPFVEFKQEEIEQSIPDRFEQQVRKYPDWLAVKGKSYSLTYDELNRAANRVARGIQERCGNGAEPIALLLDQGVSATAALLGVLKAGKFYVPLDPTYPPPRLTYMLEDSQARLIATDTQHLPLAETVGGHKQQVLNLDELDAGLSDENLDLTLSPDTLAYLLYTSGSTGTPKGVLQNHRNVLHMIKNECNGFHLCADDRLSLLYSPSVVSAARITFSALLNGAALFPFNLREEGLARLSSWLIQEEITFYNSVGTVFRHFARTLTGEENFPHLRLIVVGSETIYKSDVELYRRHFPSGCLFVATLGATEITHIRKYFVDKEVSIPDSVVPVGYPEEGLQVLLLDEAGQEVGVDTVGQIAVKGRYLNLGYWRRPDLNQTRFLPDPNGGDERIYLTGDLGRMHADGCLIHVGREDFQVKIRGHRVEAGEIETALLDHPAVKETVVVARQDQEDEKRLVAYVVPVQGATPTIGVLRRLLQAKLPDYMVPSTFVFLDALPLTPNGKVDRQALPTPERTRPELEDTFVAPCTPVEEIVADIWVEVLGLKRIGVHDNFLDLGGHSLLATQVMSRIRRAFQVELPLRRFFDAPTVAGLALAIAQRQAELVEGEETARLLIEVEDLSEGETHQRFIGGSPSNR